MSIKRAFHEWELADKKFSELSAELDSLGLENNNETDHLLSEVKKHYTEALMLIMETNRDAAKKLARLKSESEEGLRSDLSALIDVIDP